MNMLSCPLDRTRDIPLYEQLYEYIKMKSLQEELHTERSFPRNENWPII